MRFGLIIFTVLLLTSNLAYGQKPKDPLDLYRVDTEASILDAARKLMVSDKYAALITVDGDGPPRARTVLTQLGPSDSARPDKGFTVWIMTRRSTGKVEQIMKNPNVTLYYNDDAKESYVTLMGPATIYTDEYAKYFWPDLKKDFIMIGVRPNWMEVLIMPTIKNHPQNWRPQAVVFKY